MIDIYIYIYIYIHQNLHSGEKNRNELSHKNSELQRSIKKTKD